MLRTLNTFAVDLMSIPCVEDLFWYVAQNVVGKLGFVDCVIYQANDAQSDLTQVAAWGEKNPYGRNIINPLVIPFGRGITGQVAQSRKPIIVDDLLNGVDYIADTEPARSEICVPLICAGRIAGVIDSEHPDFAAFGEPELEILSTVAAMTSAKLELLAETERSQRRYEDLVIAHTQLTRETKNRKALEAKLFEARKQDAIGRLAGRFAHEFNNLLTVIAGNIELLELDAPDVGAQDSLQDARSASERGAQLIRDMLAFAQRTRLVPETLDLNGAVSGFCQDSERLLSRQVEQNLARDLWPISVDPAALENMLLALTLNGIEAMPEDGTLTITTQNIFHTLAKGQHFPADLTPGRYVRLSVTDHGNGIAAEHLTQIFDPFFTTKTVGEGTGLGLSMVMGVMRQSGGTVTVHSEVSQGSTFDLYFPAVTDAAQW
ncbi:GAF domain-containing protein [Donghicola sp. C2-DW-16]|uniref:histidine kinase n=1 Tax=Donghicola mangrovi TaxID=2729614 RepID=A0ABX2PHN6_9RHOB|nr:ATP-binding protein [Donghicola mangrovi]NVO29005.1 GAF domain-containing protein [Donghicola mangrovi]